jgi:hypothetical protein
MYQLRTSATGQFVLVDPATDTVIVADDLKEAYDRMVVASPPRGDAAEPPATSKPVVRRTLGPKLAVIGVLALLPFVWLGAMHVSLGRLVAEVAGGAGKGETSDEVRTRLDRLEQRIDQLGGGGKVAGKRNKPRVPTPPPEDDETGEDG